MKPAHYLSGSSFSIAQECPASLTIKFSKKLMTERQDAADGTEAHAAIENDLESMRRFLPAKSGRLVEHVEKRLRLLYKSFELSGGIDYFATENGTLYVVDWKTGPMGIDHLEAHQLEFYAYLILMTLPPTARKKINAVILSLVSPRLGEKKTFTRTVKEILALTEKFDAILVAIKKKEKPQTGEHCRWCNKRFVCTEFRDELKRFADPSIYGKSLLKLTAQDFKTLSVAEAAIKDIKKYVKELLEHGETIPGVSLAWRNTGRYFGEDVDASLLARLLKTDKVNVSEVKLKSPAQLEKAGFDLEKLADHVFMAQSQTIKIDKEAVTQKKLKPQKPQKPQKP